MYTCFKVQNINQGGYMYYILTGFEKLKPEFGNQLLFGDYDKEVVKDEKTELTYSNRISGEYNGIILHTLKSDTQESIDNFLTNLNRG